MPTKRLFAALPLIAPLMVLAACVPAPQQTPAPVPAPAPTPASAPVVQAPPPPAFENWIDAPVTAGNWSYAGGLAQFGQPGYQPFLTLRCDPAARAVEITRAAAVTGAQPMIVRTETLERSLATSPARSDPSSIVAILPARDPLLDAMAFSRGRFAIEVAGLTSLYIPSWPEVTRVIEDCR